jgi:hypothetical protein
VVEDLADFKGCVDPAGWLKEAGAPVLWTKDWSNFTDIVTSVLADMNATDTRAKELVSQLAGRCTDMEESRSSVFSHSEAV